MMRRILYKKADAPENTWLESLYVNVVALIYRLEPLSLHFTDERETIVYSGPVGREPGDVLTLRVAPNGCIYIGGSAPGCKGKVTLATEVLKPGNYVFNVVVDDRPQS